MTGGSTCRLTLLGFGPVRRSFAEIVVQKGEELW